MPKERNDWKTIGQALLALGYAAFFGMIWIVFGFMLAEATVHGLNPTAWPKSAVTPETWIWALSDYRIEFFFEQFDMLFRGTHPAFPDGGLLYAVALGVTWFAMAMAFALPQKKALARDPDTLFGAARFATAAESEEMRHGLEIGYLEKTQSLVRVEVEGNLISIAPPRSGKTSGLIINNLLAPSQDTSWQGPAVVIDPKGEIFKAVGNRRKELGRTVYCLDLRDKTENGQTWNPLVGLHPADTNSLMRVARAIVPEMSDNDRFFRDSAIGLLAGILFAVMQEKRDENTIPSPGDLERLLNDQATTLSIAERHMEVSLMRDLTTTLKLDERTRGSIVATAKLGLTWLLDERLRTITAKQGIDTVEIARGNADLFVIVPTEHFETMSPLLRWLLSDLFTAVRRCRQANDARLMVFIDEAASLGKFDQLPIALGELPGLGLSIWTFWQSRSQIVKNYGEEGANVFGATAEFSTFSDIGGLETASMEFFSKLLGDTTVDVPSESMQRQGDKTSMTASAGKQAARLVAAGDITSVTDDKIILLRNSSRYEKTPILLKKVRYFKEGRFNGLYEDIRPTMLSG